MLTCHISGFPVEGSSNTSTTCDVSENKCLSKKFFPSFLAQAFFKNIQFRVNLPNSSMDIGFIGLSKKNVAPAPCSLTSVGEHPNPKLICHQNICFMDFLLDLVVCFIRTNLPDLVMKGRFFYESQHLLCLVKSGVACAASNAAQETQRSIHPLSIEMIKNDHSSLTAKTAPTRLCGQMFGTTDLTCLTLQVIIV